MELICSELAKYVYLERLMTFEDIKRVIDILDKRFEDKILVGIDDLELFYSDYRR